MGLLSDFYLITYKSKKGTHQVNLEKGKLVDWEEVIESLEATLGEPILIIKKEKI